MNSSEIRQNFLQYFASKGHTIVSSSSLVPGNDPTLLFTNSGMVQFKDCFLGHDKRAYVRATSSQRCVRAGGKHNDLENVGYTARHHTFFEMLGNFSFGDYFKCEAILYAWELLTVIYKLPAEKLWVTVYAEDDEAYNIWANEVGVPAARIVRIGDNKGARYASDNFWQMADTGPCGPCSELFYDHGEEVFGGPPGSADAEGDRYIEIWNLVFMQYNRDEQGVLHPLPKPSVDTGMGLERIAAVMQHVHSNYEIDLFQNLITAAARETESNDLTKNSLKVIADHIRACAFLIVDGVIPGNEGRGYVLRRIIRRAIRHGYKLDVRAAFFYRIVPDLVAEMGVAFPELKAAQQRVMDVLKQEEERFFTTIEHGMTILESELATLGKRALLNGEIAFKLHDTFGFPLDLTQDVCREHNMTVDVAAFDTAMARQKLQARAAGKFKMAINLEVDAAATIFHGYDTLEWNGNVLALYKEGAAVNELLEGEMGVVVLDNTPFYAESGGQVGDCGVLQSSHGVFAVEDTQKIQASVFGHHGVMKAGKLTVGNNVNARVDVAARNRTMRNHSATHLMHKALREVLGSHVQQKGSLVDAEKTRFDFVHTQPMTDAEIHRVENLVNAEILSNAATQARSMTIDDAQKTGALMLFGEKYGDEVRVLNIGTSRELCGGTHVARTGDIGLFKIVSESGVAAGVRRVEAVTGDGALAYIQQQENQLQQVASAIKSQPAEAAARVMHIIDNVKSLEKELATLKSKLASAQGDDLIKQVVEVNGVKILAAEMTGADAKSLRETLDKLKDKLKNCVVLLAATEAGKVTLIAGVSADLTAKVKAGELVNFVAQQMGGKGGGRADMAQAGGTQPEHLPAALKSVTAWVGERL
ncbi:MAG: alanine--tRNA ligase [Candidatus Nitrotoga sp.]